MLRWVLKDIECRYRDGQVIFREGDQSATAFVIVSGQVELSKISANGPIRLSILSPGEIFGEMGIIDKSARSVTAQAVGTVVLDVIERDGFLASLSEQPEVALTVIGNLAERLRHTNDLIFNPQNNYSSSTSLTVQTSPPNGTPDVQRRRATVFQNLSWRAVAFGAAGKSSLLHALMSLFLPPASQRKHMEFRVAKLAGDEDGSQTELLVQSFAGQTDIRVKVLSESLPVEMEEENGRFLSTANLVARQRLQGEDADLLICGNVNEIGTVIRLRFVSLSNDSDHPGAFLVTDRLALPTGFSEDFGELLFAVSLAATVPRNEAHRQLIKPMLLPALEAAQESGQQPPLELNNADRATIQVCYGNVTALIGYYASDPNWLRRAALAYQEAIEGMTREDEPIGWGNTQFHLSRVRQTLGERGSDPEIIENALTGFKDALGVFNQQEFPWEWAALQARIGNAYYRLDAINGDTDLLKDAIAGYQSALQVYTKADAPLKWSEVKNNLGQALQVWGDLARNRELLVRAVQACQESLQVRSRIETPLLWAASQNNLGSALFLLGRMTEDSEHLEGAAEAFGRALEIYLAYGSARLTKVAERNMSKAENLLRARLARRVAKLYWEEEPGDGQAGQARRKTTFRKENLADLD